MTEMVNGMSQSTDTSSSQPVIPSVASSDVSERNERTFNQSEVSDIVKRAKYGAVEDYKRMVSERPDYVREKNGDSNSSPSYNEDTYRKIAAEEIQRFRDQWTNEANEKNQQVDAQKLVQEFWNKVLPGRERYQDFDQVVGDIEFARFPNVVQLLARYVDNSDAVLYEMGKDRFKMAQLEQLALLSPKDAIVQAQRLSQSIKDRDNGSNERIANPPLGQLRPSNTGTDNGAMSVRDFRKKYKV